MNDLLETKIEIPEDLDVRQFLLKEDLLQKTIEQNYQVRLVIRGHLLKLIGKDEEVRPASIFIRELIRIAKKNGCLTDRDLSTVLKINKTEAHGTEFSRKEETIQALNGLISARSEGQEKLLAAFHNNDIIFAVGPAGTGKTYLAVAKAIQYLKNNRVRKIVLARPAVEAGESLGFLPGDFRDKVDPYLKPLYDALEDMLPIENLKKYLDQEIIEIIPLAYMRGRTLNNAFVILDEAQNATAMQMKMFLTRLGKNSRAVITGDLTQIDLPVKRQSGLVSSIRLLKDIKGISIVHLTRDDVDRHTLVKEIIDAYERFDTESKQAERSVEMVDKNK